MKKTGSPEFIRIAESLKAVAHPERLAILNLLAETPGQAMFVKNIYGALGLAQFNVSRHLIILKRCGLVIKEGSGTVSAYRLNTENEVASSIINCLQSA